MPELPDVQVFREYVDATSLHQRIEHVEVDADGMLEGVASTKLEKRLETHELRSTRRHGKHLFVAVDGGGWLRLHFGMTGELTYRKRLDDLPEHTRLRLDFANGYHLAYVNVRKLGEIGWVDDVAAFVAESNLGPDALKVSGKQLGELLESRRGSIKSALMDQELMAGIGNIYADEVLFQAKIHPATKVADLGDDDIERLSNEMSAVLHAAIAARVQDFPDSFMLPHRGSDERCPHCDAALNKTKVSGRTTYYCPEEQEQPGRS